MAIGGATTARSGWWSGLVRPERRLDSITLMAVIVAACLPIAAAASRGFAFPWSGAPLLLSPLRALGSWLNAHLAFDWVPPADRPTIFFLLQLPIGALLIAVFRLVLGIRVLGMRAILLGLGIQGLGLLPGLFLMLVIVSSIALIRPWIRNARLPKYARLTFILGLSAMIMVSAVFVAPWLGSSTVWKVAFFPAIMTAMFAEGVAKSLEQDDVVMATWRAAGTITLALVFGLVDRPVSRLVYQAPELIVTQLMAIVLLAELVDLRLLEAWPTRISRRLFPPRPKVAVVYNRDTDGTASPGRPMSPRSVEHAVTPRVKALRQQGFEVKVFEGDGALLGKLARYLSPDLERGTPGGIVLNLATGARGEGAGVHVPAMLEMAGIPYTGPGPLAQARLADRFALLTLLRRAKVPVPRHFLAREPADVVDAELPASVQPRFAAGAHRRSVRDLRSLRSAVREFRRRYGQDTLVERMTRGRRISAALLGNDLIECLPLVEHTRGSGAKTCPALLDDAIADRVRAHAHAAFRAAGCRDYARIDVRVPRSGEPVVVDVKWSDLFARQGAFLTAAQAAGLSCAAVTRRIVAEAARRYVSSLNQPGESTGETTVLTLDKARAAMG